MHQEEPLYNIGVVSRITDIPENTLRAWERRYDFPQSSRTEGGHRLYTQAEIKRIQWIKQRLGEGLQISRAVQALNHLETEGTVPGAPLSELGSGQHLAGATLDSYRSAVFEALVTHDQEEADRLLGELLALHSVETLVLDVISPVIAEIGNAWEDQQISVATEHFATQHLRHHLLMWMRTGAPPYKTNPVVLACAPGEFHEGGLLSFGVLLRRMRWPVAYLGQAVPLRDLAEFAVQTRPSAIVIVAMTPETARELDHLADILAQSPLETTICIGGRAFIDNHERAETLGIYLGDSLHEGVEALDRLLRQQNPFVE